jgi:hypothetical protein
MQVEGMDDSRFEDDDEEEEHDGAQQADANGNR